MRHTCVRIFTLVRSVSLLIQAQAQAQAEYKFFIFFFPFLRHIFIAQKQFHGIPFYYISPSAYIHCHANAKELLSNRTRIVCFFVLRCTFCVQAETERERARELKFKTIVYTIDCDCDCDMNVNGTFYKIHSMHESRTQLIRISPFLQRQKGVNWWI